MTFATDNFEAGLLIGKWAAATLGDKAATAKIAMLDINKDNISVDVARDTGFLKGFGIEVPDLTVMGVLVVTLSRQGAAPSKQPAHALAVTQPRPHRGATRIGPMAATPRRWPSSTAARP